MEPSLGEIDYELSANASLDDKLGGKLIKTNLLIDVLVPEILLTDELVLGHHSIHQSSLDKTP